MAQSTNVLHAAQQLGLAFAVTSDPAAIAKLLADCIRDLLGTDAVAIFTWDEAVQRLVTMYSTPAGPGFEGIRSGQGAVGRAFEQRRPTVATDRPSPCDAPAWDMTPGVQVVAAVPLMVAGAAVGVLSAARTEKKLFTPADVDLLATFGALALAPTIELNRLRGRLREAELRIALLQTRAETGELKRRLGPGHTLRQIEAEASAQERCEIR